MTISQMEFAMNHVPYELSPHFTEAIQALREGKVVLLLDARDRENEGDLIVAAEKITSVTMNFLIKQGSGVVCLAMPKKRLLELGLPPMITNNTNVFETAFTISIEASQGVTTGVSARDRAHTIQVAIADDAHSSHLARPGHVFPLAARTNGVFERMGHTEGSVDLVKIAGLKPGAVLCELMNADGSMTTGKARLDFAKTHNIPVISVEEVLFYRLQTETVFEKMLSHVSTNFGELNFHSYKFFDGLTINILHRNNLALPSRGARLRIASGDNLAGRFLAQVLNNTDDDPFVDALHAMKQDEIDLAIMYTGHEQSPAKTASELHLRIHASIACALQDMGINEISPVNTDDELLRIIHNYFSSKHATRKS